MLWQLTSPINPDFQREPRPQLLRSSFRRLFQPANVEAANDLDDDIIVVKEVQKTVSERAAAVNKIPISLLVRKVLDHDQTSRDKQRTPDLLRDKKLLETDLKPNLTSEEPSWIRRRDCDPISTAKSSRSGAPRSCPSRSRRPAWAPRPTSFEEHDCWEGTRCWSCGNRRRFHCYRQSRQ